jgi:ADP-heptose:LPS heptosyltransferase
VGLVDRLLADAGASRGEFIVLHPGAGAPVKEWPVERWHQLAERLTATGATLVFTGQGPREHELIRTVISGLPRCVDLCDRLDWASFVQVIRLARRVISVDTVAAHVAGAVDTPATTLWTSPSDPHHWGALGATSVILDAAASDAVEQALGAAP